MSNKVMSILLDESPLLQQVSIDEAFLDVSPTPVNREHPVDVARRIQRRVCEFGVTCSVGVGSNKTVAKIASDLDKPQGLTVVWPGTERDFLAPLPVRSLSGIGKASHAVFQRHGIRTLGQLASADDSVLAAVFGKNADVMRRRCLGIDESSVACDDEVKSVSNEVTLSEDVRIRSELKPIIESVASKVARRLRKKHLAGITVGLKLRFADRTTRSAQHRLSSPVDNEVEFIPILLDLLPQIWNEGIPVRLVGVAVSGFANEDDGQQSMMLELFPAEETRAVSSERAGNLALATDEIKDRFGESALIYGRDLSILDKTTGTCAKNPADYR